MTGGNGVVIRCSCGRELVVHQEETVDQAVIACVCGVSFTSADVKETIGVQVNEMKSDLLKRFAKSGWTVS